MNAPFPHWDQPRAPSALDAAQALFGAILNDPEALDRVRSLVDAEDFQEDLHALIFRTMCERRDAGEPIDANLVKMAIGDRELGGATVGEYLARLRAEATTISGAPGYAKMVRSAGMMRSVLELGREAVQAMSAPGIEDPAKFAAKLIDQLDRVAVAGAPETARRVTVGEAAGQAFRAMQDARAGRRQTGVTFGIPSLDRMTLGMRDGQLIVIAGRPGMGKTSFTVAVALAAARAGYGTYFVSLEMVAQELAERAMACLAYDPHSPPIPYRSIAKGIGLSDTDVWRLEEVRDRLDALPLLIEQQSGLNVSQIAARARNLRAHLERRGQKLNLVVVDHLGLIRPTTRYSGNRTQEVTETTGALKVLAKELGVPLVVASQLSREAERRPLQDRRPTLADLRDSGSIEQDADLVIGLFREAYYLEHKVNRSTEEDLRFKTSQHTLEAEILKQRQGPTGRKPLFCRMDSNVIADPY